MILVCPSCGAKNRVPEEKLHAQPSCGQCHQLLLPLAPIELNEENFSQFIAHSDLPVLIDLWAEWCGPCKMMAPHFAQVAAQNAQVIFAKIDTEKSPRLSSAFNVRSIPTLVLMNKTHEIARISGALRSTELQQWLDQQLKANPGS
ncbi:MAG: thioredoxin TrxC [Acinetobacter sp.]|uniref:thioredoxin TrxC n=1 Tax=Acinetobacter TaxID=469 RepID=UPI00257E899D|nr:MULTISPECIES: thioredoxin TrxC [Acinetobacter]MBR5556444.1 thioredoxin TrxC [Acinetobacter sp.]